MSDPAIRLRRVVVERFRGITGPLDVAFAPGLTLVHGGNESGKSTLGEAIWQGLTARAKGRTQLHKSFAPWTGAASPVVRVHFEHGATPWSVTKRFLSAGESTVLERLGAAPSRWEGDEAERELRAMLGVGAPGRQGAVAADDRGLWSLTWVRHGQAGVSIRDAVTFAAQPLRERLAASTESVLVGALAQRVWDGAAEEFATYYTETGRPKAGKDAPLARAQRALDVAIDLRDALRERRDAFERDVARRAELAAQRRDAQASLQDARDAFDRALERVAELEDARELATAAEHACELAQAAHGGLAVEVERRSQLRADLAEKQRAVEEIASDALDGQVAAVKLARDEARAACASALDASSAAESAQEKAASALADHDAAEAWVLASARLAAWQSDEATYRGATSALKSNPVTEAAWQALEDAWRRAERARERLDAVAPRVNIEARVEADVTVNGAPERLRAGERMDVDAAEGATIGLSDALIVHIQGGAADWEALRLSRKAADDALSEQLRLLDVSSVEEAGALARERREAAAEQRSAGSLLRRAAGQPSDSSVELGAWGAALRADVEAALAGCRSRDIEPSSHFDPDADDAGARAALRAELALALERARQHGESARRAHRAAEGALQEAESALSLAEVQQAHAHQRRAELGVELDKLRAQLAERLEGSSDLELGAQLATAADGLLRAEAEGRKLGAALALLEDAPSERADAEARVDAAERSARTLQSELDQLSGRLAASEAGGLDVRVEGADGDVEEARANLALVQERADAARRLIAAFEATSQSREDAFRRPVLAHLEPLVARVFPGADAELDASLDVVGLTRQGVHASFAELSAGASEQLGLLARLALADLLHQGGGFPVVLDDPLVNTDARRFPAMVAAINDVAQRVQVVLLTCSPGVYRSAGLRTDSEVELPLLHSTE